MKNTITLTEALADRNLITPGITINSIDAGGGRLVAENLSDELSNAGWVLKVNRKTMGGPGSGGWMGGGYYIAGLEIEHDPSHYAGRFE